MLQGSKYRNDTMTTMIAQDTGRSAPALDTLRRRFGTALADFAAWRARRALYRQTFVELSTLTDRDLADLGFARCDIPRIARDSAREV
jgi:uncharacterized protein YjiS (DUF1127 family)